MSIAPKSAPLLRLRSQERKHRRSFRLLKMRVIVATLSVLFALAISEIALRAFNYRPGTMDAEMYVGNDNEQLPYKLRPNYHGYCAGEEVNTDGDGYRIVSPTYDELFANKNLTPAKEILLLGDSGVFGFGLSDRETIASQLQELSFSKGLNYRIRNIGVSGYTSWNELAAAREYLNRHSATDIVVLYMPNDLTLENDYFGIGKGKTASFSRNEAALHRITGSLYSHLYISYLVSDGIKRLASRVNPVQEALAFDEERSQKTIDYSIQALLGIRELCEEKNIRFTVGIYRDVAYFADPRGWLQYEEAIARNLTRHGIKSLVVKSHIESLTPEQVRVSWNDPHPSAKAAGLIAEEILKAVWE